MLGHQAHPHLPGGSEATRGRAVPGQAGPVVGLKRGGLYPEEKGPLRPRSSALVGTYGLYSILEPDGHPRMEPLVKKSRLCHCVL